MLVNSVMFNIWAPAEYLPADHKVYLAVDGKTELTGPGMVDKRPFLLTVFDPFDVHGLITGADHKNKFWERDGIGGPKDETEATDVETAERGGVVKTDS